MYENIPDNTHPNYGMGNIGGGFATPLSPPPSVIGNMIHNDIAQFKDDMNDTLPQHDNISIAESAGSSKKGDQQQSLGLADFYGKYLANANELTRNQHGDQKIQILGKWGNYRHLLGVIMILNR